ncbi:VOC family protein [Nocardioides sp.]|uniref:VOC family protein n=1 Tax=Nocardioides sp. TaxID=35761 RepID=UPI00261AB34D|nr:VOC family protein [Nocardioides sp.]
MNDVAATVAPTWTWLNATLDLPDESFGLGKAFWGAATGFRPQLSSDNDPNYAVLQPETGTPYLWLQRLIDGEPGVHLDLHVGPGASGSVDLAGAVRHAERHGARLVTQTSYAVMASPAGVPFCLLPDSGTNAPIAPAPAAWPGGRSRVDQVCLDIASEAWDAECAFWAALTGWPLRGDDAWARLWTPAAWPLRVLLQRRQVGETSSHLDVSCDDRAAELARWSDLGARVIGEGPRWTVVETPGELVTCLTTRSPDTGRIPADVPPPGAP